MRAATQMYLLLLMLPLLAAAPDDQKIRLRMLPPEVVSGGTCDAANVAAGASGCPLLTQAKAFGSLDGGFCIPNISSNGTYIGATPNWALGYDPTAQTFFGGGNDNTGGRWVVELQPPATWVVASSGAGLNEATIPTRGALVDPSEGRFATTSGPFPGDVDSSVITVPTATLVYDTNKLMVSWQYYYTNGSPTLNAFMTRPIALNDTGHVVGFDRFAGKAGTEAATHYIDRMTASFCGAIPTEWQTALGGAYFCGNGGTHSIISTQSYGPAMFVVNPALIGTGTGVADPLVFYPADHQTLGGWDDWVTGEMFEITTQVTGAAIIGGTRTALFFGSMGTTSCYGPGLSDPMDPLIGTPYPPPSGPFTYCYDPLLSGEGQHGYPYYYRAWAYDLNDFKKVRDGTTNPGTGQPWKPWDVRPYALWDVTLPIPRVNPGEALRTRGLQYDQTTHKLFAAQDYVCAGTNSAVWKFSVDITP